MKPTSVIHPLKSRQIQKLALIQTSLAENKTLLEILDGLIDVGYSNALKNLYENGLITHQNYQEQKRQLPSYLQDLMPI